MSAQRSLFDTGIPLAPGRMTERERAAIPTGAPAEDAKRLEGQCRAILERLKAGPATGPELATFGMNHTARVSNLRAAGYPIVGKRQKGGVWEYRLTGKPNGT